MKLKKLPSKAPGQAQSALAKLPVKMRTPLMVALLNAAEELGYKIKLIPFQNMETAKKKSRAQDKVDMATGKATPAQIQQRNDLLPGKITVLDWSPSWKK